MSSTPSETAAAKPSPEPPIEPANQKPAPQPVKNNRHLIWWFTLFLLLTGLIWFLLYIFYFQYYESTDDAYANGNLINVNSAISGSVVAFYADDTDLVQEGQMLARLDCTDYQVRYEKELATLASTVLQVRQLYDNVRASRTTVENKRVAWRKAKYDYKNRSELVGSQAISNEDYIHAQDDLHTAELDLQLAEMQLIIAKDLAGSTDPEKHPNIEQQKAAVREAYYQLFHCVIYAPTTGYIAQRNVDVGEWVTPATPLMAIIPTDYVWVDANYKETQLTYMRVGQPATVWFDMYGRKVKYHGKVLGIASGSGSVFSLIPPQNATGNWIKIVQRLPVRISLDPETVKNYPVRLGISAEVDVDLTNQDLPMLVQAPSFKPVATTEVFDVKFDEVNRRIDEIIHDKLRS